jgi:hypothetical protein
LLKPSARSHRGGGADRGVRKIPGSRISLDFQYLFELVKK